MARLVIWHGYLLGGTGSNIYSINVVEAWVKAGHDVVLMCQDPHPERHATIHSYERVDGRDVVEQRDLVTGGAAVRREQGLGACTMVQADIDALLPVYLLDRYPGFDVHRFVDLDDARIERYCQRYDEAMRGVIERFDPHGVLLNHVVMGPPAMRSALDDAGVPYVVKIHGSELEYAIVEDARFIEPARRGLAGARRILAGSAHIARRTDELLGSACSEGRMSLVPPGVDLDLFAPATEAAHRATTRQRLLDVLGEREAKSQGRGPGHGADLQAALDLGPDGLIERLRALHGAYQERDPELGAAAALAKVDLDTEPLIAVVGKMIRQKGIHLLLAALPLVLQRVPTARVAFVGFGSMRELVEALAAALSRGDMTLVDEMVEHGAQLDGGSDEPFVHLRDFFAGLRERGELDDYLAAAAGMHERLIFTGQVDHMVLSLLWPLCTTSLVPSIAAEAFGMVSAEAASCGCPPVVAHHSGLADVADALVAGYPGWARELASFSLDQPEPVIQLADVVAELCSLDRHRHIELGAAARTVVENEWSWFSIAARIADMFTESPVGA